MIFLHLSDIHFLRKYIKAKEGYNSIFNNMTNPIIQIEKVLEKIDKNTLDFIIITGDLVESGESEDYKELKENLDKLFGDIPYIVTLGNHDNKRAFYKGWFNEEDKDTPYNTTMDIAGLKIISLDNSRYHNNNGIIDEESCIWLKEELKKEDSYVINDNINTNKESFIYKDIILILHHHLLEEQFNLPPVSFNSDFYNIVKDSSIIGIFSGHTHHPYKSIFAGKQYFTAGSLSFVGYNQEDGIVRFEEETKCNICKYEDGKLYVENINILEKAKFLANVKF